mgnify:CR=1 FL=1
MANPQREDGHIDIANKIADHLAKTQLSGYESRVLWALLRQTWGYVIRDKKGRMKRDKDGQFMKKKSAVIPSKKWEELTGLNKHNASRTLRELELRQIVIKFDNRNEWGFQKDYDKWLQPIKEIVIKNDNTYFVIKNDNAFVKNDNGISKIDNEIWSRIASGEKKRGAKKLFKENLKENTTAPNRSKKKQKIKINFNFNKEEWENIEEKDKQRWTKAYPACDIKIELAQMEEWLLANPKKRKKNYRRFITNWLSHSQERGGTKKINPKTEMEKWLEKKQKEEENVKS